MSKLQSSGSNFRSISFGAHQLVSEQSDPALESSKGGSSGHGESGGTTMARGRASSVEDRLLSIEETMEALAGTVINLNGKFDHLNGKFDHLSCKLDRMMEELPRSRRDIDEPSRSRRDHDLSGCKLHQTTPLHHAPLHYSTAAPSLFSVQMCHSQIHAERIKILTLAFQKYKGDSKSPEEQLQILNAAAQRYKARRDSKATEEQPQLYSPSPPKYHTASYVFDEMHEREPETVDEALVTVTVVEPTGVVVIESTTSECLPVENEVAEKTNVEIDILALKRMVKSVVTGPQVVALMASATAFTPGGIFHQQDQTLIRFPIETHIFGGMQMGAPHSEDPWQIIWDPGIGSFNSEGLDPVADIAMNDSGTMLPYSGNEKVLLVWDPGINFLVSDSVLMQGISESFKLRTMWDPGIPIHWLFTFTIWRLLYEISQGTKNHIEDVIPLQMMQFLLVNVVGTYRSVLALVPSNNVFALKETLNEICVDDMVHSMDLVLASSAVEAALQIASYVPVSHEFEEMQREGMPLNVLEKLVRIRDPGIDF